ncbi:MAG: hypothetical protein H0U64_05355 [Gemmatimonadaceae bacterium]|nr:hypothetical protein [Gemmatimonadaceae bacterium]
MKFNAFARLNGGFGFSSRPPHGQRIYEAMRDTQGDAYDTDFDSLQQARLYAQAMCVGAAQYQLDRAANNRNPLKATELLPSLERDYQIVSAYGATLTDRRRVVAARALTTRGARREAIEDALRTLLGADFIAYETTATADIEKFPSTPGDIGVFARAGSQKKLIQITGYVSTINIPTTVDFTSLGGTDAPIAGESYTVEPDSRNPNIEKITVSSVTPTTITATFTKPHVAGTIATRPHPVFISSKRYSRVVVTFAAATNQETRRKINEQMKRQLRGVSQWCIVQAGTFHLGHATLARLNATRLT